MRFWRRGILLVCVATANLVVLLFIGTMGTWAMMAERFSIPAAIDACYDNVQPPRVWEMLHDSFWWGCCGLPAIVVIITQIIFILPLLGSRPVMAPHGKSLARSIAIAALIAAALSVGLLFAFTELFHVFEALIEWVYNDRFRDHLPPLLGGWFGALWPWIFIVIGWVIWTPLLLTFARKRPGRTRWSRWVFALLGGTVLETLIVVPIDVMVRRRSDCYCGSGSFFALVISMWALLWLTGPGIVIAATSKRRRLWAETHCIACGHEKGPTPGERCPECGVQWAVTRRGKP